MLNHAAALVFNHRISRPLLIGGCFVIGLAFIGATQATALDAIDLNVPAAERAEGECSPLVSIKYPLRACPTGELGQTDADDTWDNARTIPIGSDFIEGNGYWGDDLNQD